MNGSFRPEKKEGKPEGVPSGIGTGESTEDFEVMWATKMRSGIMCRGEQHG